MVNKRLCKRVRLIGGSVALLALSLFGSLACDAGTEPEVPQLSAQDILLAACERTAEPDFDLLMTIEGGFDGETATGIYDVQVSRGSGTMYEDDIYMQVTVGELMGEILYVDGVQYIREPGGAWTLSDPQSRMSVAGMLRGYESPLWKVEMENSLCPEFGPVATVGEETVSEVGDDHYRLTATGVGAPDGPTGQVDENTYISPGQDMTWDYWLNEDGQLLKMQQLITQTDNKDAGQVLITTVVSGVGEPNVIEAPMVQ